MRPSLLTPLLALLLACSSSSAPPSPASAPPGDAGADAPLAESDSAPPGDADAAVDKSAACVAQFGSGIGSVGFARFDGTVVAVLPPGDQACPQSNPTHLVLELRTGGDVYRMVVNVDDTSSPGTIRAAEATHPLVGDAWSAGWHAVPLDYVATLGLHTTAFATKTRDDAVAWVTDALDVGERVSVFATAQGEANSAHLVHRNRPNADGAIVLEADTASPRWLLFSFADQSF